MILGIDLGTSNSMAAVYKDGEVFFVTEKSGNKQIPSVVSMDEKGCFYAGEIAKERKMKYPQSSADMFKRYMGTKEIFKLGEKEFKAEELSAILLKTIKEDAANCLGEPVTEAVISVPAFFNNAQRMALMNAGKLAGLTVRKIVNEPTAAAMAYGVHHCEEEEKVIIVLDLGGGTFDISVMEVNQSIMEVVAICGDNHLGGGDFTERLIQIFLHKSGIEQEVTPAERAALWSGAQRAKHRITESGEGILTCKIGGKEYTQTITEKELETACMDLLEKIRRLVLGAIEESKYEPHEIGDIILVGGGTKLSIVHRMMERMAGKELGYEVDPDEAVVKGTALYGAMLEKEESVKQFVITDISPFYIGRHRVVATDADIVNLLKVIIPKNITIPVKKVITSKGWGGSYFSSLYQSQDKYGINKMELGEIEYILPVIEEDECFYEESICYDANGIINYEIFIPANGMRFKSVMADKNCGLSEEEIEQRLAEENYLTLAVTEENEEQILLWKADRVYEECSNREKKELSAFISELESALQSGKVTAIKAAKKRLESAVARYGNEIF